MSERKINSDTAAENQMPVANAAPKLLFNISEAAERLSISVPSIRKLIRQCRIRRVPDFRKVLISDAELRRFASAE